MKRFNKSSGTVDITFNADGSTDIKVEGVKGSSCTKLTEDIESAIGVTKSSKKTREYREKEQRQGRKATQ